MNERETAYRIRQHLNAGVDALDGTTLERLEAARKLALAHIPGPVGDGDGLRRFAERFLSPYGRSLAMAACLILVAAVGSYWTNIERLSALEEVDTALLSDDLPIDAYLDQGFDQWLASAS